MNESALERALILAGEVLMEAIDEIVARHPCDASCAVIAARAKDAWWAALGEESSDEQALEATR